MFEAEFPGLITCLLGVWLGGISAAGPARAEEAPLARQHLQLESRLGVAIHYPRADMRLPPAPGCGVYVSGRAGVRLFDVVLVIDTSASTADPSGADIDGDGVVGRAWLDEIGEHHNSDGGDSIMAAEVAAARQLVRELDAETTHVGVVTFAGEERGPLAWLTRPGPSARTRHALSRNYTAVDQTLAALLSHQPAGSTDIAAAIDQAVANFGPPDPKKRRLVMFFTDGFPTLPHGPRQEANNVIAVLDAARRARGAEVEVHTFAIGREAVEWPLALIETAGRTGGVFTPVRHPADLVDMVTHAGVGDLQRVTLRNATTGVKAWPFAISPDGAFHGFVPLAQGKNELEVSATSTIGVEARRAIAVMLDPNSESEQVPASLVRRQTRLLEECLRFTKRKRRAAEATRTEQVRRRLEVEIERGRREARERAEQQRKRLDLDVDRP